MPDTKKVKEVVSTEGTQGCLDHSNCPSTHNCVNGNCVPKEVVIDPIKPPQ